MNKRTIVFSVISLLSLSGIVLSDYNPFYIQLQPAGEGVAPFNILIDELMLSCLNGGMIYDYQTSTFQNKTKATISFPTATSVQIKFEDPCYYNVNLVCDMQYQIYDLPEHMNSNSLTAVEVSLPDNIQPGTVSGNKVSINVAKLGFNLFNYTL